MMTWLGTAFLWLINPATLVQRLWRAVLGLAVVAGLLYFVYDKIGDRREKQVMARYDAAAKVAKADQDKLTKKAADDYEAKLSKLAAVHESQLNAIENYAKKLPKNAACRGVDAEFKRLLNAGSRAAKN
jgi:flagellar biosynthesis/type III secretory pathway M-ring protein FliF/YscJ